MVKGGSFGSRSPVDHLRVSMGSRKRWVELGQKHDLFQKINKSNPSVCVLLAGCVHVKLVTFNNENSPGKSRTMGYK